MFTPRVTEVRVLLNGDEHLSVGDIRIEKMELTGEDGKHLTITLIDSNEGEESND